MSTTTSDTALTSARLLRTMMVALSLLVAGISGVAFYMSFSVLRDLAERSGIPASVAWGLPVVIDGSIVTAILVILAWRMCGQRQALPWVVLVAFSIVSIVGNAAHVAIAYDAQQGVPLWLAITMGAIAPIGLLTSCEMLVRLPKASDLPAVAAEDLAAPAITAEALAGPVAAPVAAGETTGDPVAASIATPDATGEDTSEHDHTGDAVATPMTSAVAADEVTGDPVAAPRTAAVADGETTGESAGDEPVEAGEPVADGVGPSPVSVAAVAPVIATGEDDIATGDVTGERDVAALVPMHPVPATPVAARGPAEQVEWVLDEVRAGRELTWSVVAEELGLSTRQAQRRLTDARKRAPELFELVSA